MERSGNLEIVVGPWLSRKIWGILKGWRSSKVSDRDRFFEIVVNVQNQYSPIVIDHRDAHLRSSMIKRSWDHQKFPTIVAETQPKILEFTYCRSFTTSNYHRSLLTILMLIWDHSLSWAIFDYRERYPAEERENNWSQIFHHLLYFTPGNDFCIRIKNSFPLIRLCGFDLYLPLFRNLPLTISSRFFTCSRWLIGLTPRHEIESLVTRLTSKSDVVHWRLKAANRGYAW